MELDLRNCTLPSIVDFSLFEGTNLTSLKLGAQSPPVILHGLEKLHSLHDFSIDVEKSLPVSEELPAEKEEGSTKKSKRSFWLPKKNDSQEMEHPAPEAEYKIEEPKKEAKAEPSKKTSTPITATLIT